ncbi:MAG TPA: hypothetical protein VKQ73_17005 [Stellaceae bacterium]|nr:hypothetical protein [Stellaceae bacterium]
MTRVGALVWFVLVLAAGFATFKVKYAVQDIEDQLNHVRKQTVAEQHEIRVLNADWAYLNQPERLADLNRRFLGLVPITAHQLQQKIADIALRPPPAAEPAAPDVVVAAAPATPPATPTTPSPGLPVQLVKATPGAAPDPLDALIAQIAEAR